MENILYFFLGMLTCCCGTGALPILVLVLLVLIDLPRAGGRRGK